MAVPLAIAGGQIAVFEVRFRIRISSPLNHRLIYSVFLLDLCVFLQLSQPGKLPDTALPTIQNSVNVADFCWDPFDPHRLVVGGFSLLIVT